MRHHQLGCLLLTFMALASSVAALPRTSLAQPVAVKIDAGKTGDEINPFIYGQFIEHLGRCIYGGIWAQMLEDRKFYFPITAEYDPYTSLTDTPFPVVGRSPWQIIGDASGVSMVEEDSFVGDHTPHLAAGAGIRQKDLALEQGERYVGYAWLKADGGSGKARVTLVQGEGDGANSKEVDLQVTGEYTKLPFEFTADTATGKAQLEIRNTGDSKLSVGTISLMPADNVRGMRPDTLALLKQLNSPQYRWPGGNFVSGYDWRDGIGDRDRRPPRVNPAWTGVEHNDFGLDEFVDFCKEVGAEPLITVNTGFGDAYTAAQEVEYCNGGADTLGGSWRAKNGHPEPYDLKYWCVGNEMFGDWQLGYMKLSQYVLKHNRFVNAMLAVDPDLNLIAVGELAEPTAEQKSNRDTSWSEGMLRNCLENMDAISEHFYVGRVPWAEGGQDVGVVEHIALVRDQIRAKAKGYRELQAKVGISQENLVPVAMDEWNYWHRKYEYGELGCQYDLKDALGIAMGLHEYYRNSDIIHMASYAQTVNVIGCIKTTKTDAFFDPTALPLMVYRAQWGKTPLEVSGDYDEATLDVAAALTEDGAALTVGIVNAAKDAKTLKLDVAGKRLTSSGQQWQVSGDDPAATNDAENARVAVKESAADLSQGEVTVPGYSFTVVRVGAQ